MTFSEAGEPLDLAVLRAKVTGVEVEPGCLTRAELADLLAALEAAQAERDWHRDTSAARKMLLDAHSPEAAALRLTLQEVARLAEIEDIPRNYGTLFHRCRFEIAGVAAVGLSTGAGKTLAEELQEFRKWKAEHGG